MDQQWTSYNAAVGEYSLPKSTMAPVPYQTSSSETGITGFQDLKPANPEVQARYDAMSPKWEGITGTDSAVFKNIPKSQSAPAFSK